MTSSSYVSTSNSSSDILLHSDRTLPALVHAAEIEWIASPQSGVARRMLERNGGEIALASSIVRYAPKSVFPFHRHTFGEEFLVLEGTFSDASGDFSAGTYVRNPANSSHAPFSREGCVIFVKLRQMLADEPESARVYPDQQHWSPAAGGGYDAAMLYENRRLSVQMLRLSAGARLPERIRANGEEILVVEGSVTLRTFDQSRGSPIQLKQWSWYRHPGTVHGPISTDTGALLWVKSGHL